MMLFYKAWRESQTRFLVGALALAGYCAFMVMNRSGTEGAFSERVVGHSYGEYIDSLVFSGFGKLVFVLPVIFLGLGGLLRERARHTAESTDRLTRTLQLHQLPLQERDRARPRVLGGFTVV